MANLAKVHRAPIYVELDKPREMIYNLRAFARMEEKYGSIDAAMEAMESGSIVGISFMLWCGLITKSPELTLEDVQDAIDIRDMEYISNVMSNAMQADMPGKDPNK